MGPATSPVVESTRRSTVPKTVAGSTPPGAKASWACPPVRTGRRRRHLHRRVCQESVRALAYYFCRRRGTVRACGPAGPGARLRTGKLSLKIGEGSNDFGRFEGPVAAADGDLVENADQAQTP